MDAVEFERRLRALAVREGLTFASFVTLHAADRAVLQTTLVQRFDPQASYRERDVNEILKGWLDSVGVMVETDHVHLRRWLVDTNVLMRKDDCSEYRIHPQLELRPDLVRDAAVAQRDAAAIVAEARRTAQDRRAARRAEWMKRSGAEGAGSPAR